MTTTRDVSSEDSWKLRLLQVRSLTLGVVEEDVLTVVEWTQPTPLPFAPVSVMGVASIQGRMFTVVDVASLLGEVTFEGSGFIVALRGDEQLALACDEASDVEEVKPADIINESESSLIQGNTQVRGKNVLVLDVARLFAGVIRGQERRRRRL
ncbi:MAG TPA: CheW domain-containing protein [Pyrinomonadaceae bacterium]|nr:CheW domain-containing protein [Pyrinomonadaceae bacterium]